jgi:hypothetical protein
MTSRPSRPDVSFVLAFLLLDMADRRGVRRRNRAEARDLRGRRQRPSRATVGPVAHVYEVFGPLAAGYTDETARTLARRNEPWAAAYAIAAPAPPYSLQLRWDAEARQPVLNSDHPL